MLKTIIAGSRNITDYQKLKDALSYFGVQKWSFSEVVSGGAKGVDALGEQWAKEHNVPLTIFPADWQTHGKAAGPIRNRAMAQYADRLIVLWDGASKGTLNMIHEAEKAGLIVVGMNYGKESQKVTAIGGRG